MKLIDVRTGSRRPPLSLAAAAAAINAAHAAAAADGAADGAAAGMTPLAGAAIVAAIGLALLSAALWRRIGADRARLAASRRVAQKSGAADAADAADAAGRREDGSGAIADALPIGFVRFDAGGRVLRSNARYRDLIGWPSGPGARPFDGVARFEDIFGERGEGDDFGRAIWRDRLAAATAVEIDGAEGAYVEFVTADGRLIAGFDRIDEDGGLTGVRFDASALAQAPAQPVLDGMGLDPDEAARKLRSVFSLTPVGSWSFDRVSRALTWDRTAREIFDVDEEFQPTIENVASFCAPASREELQRSVRTAVDEAAEFECEIEIVKRDGDRIWARVVGEPEAKGDEVVRITGGIQDITLQKRQSEALRIANQELLDVMKDLDNAEKRFFDIAAVSNDWFWETDAEGRFVYISDSFERETGADPMKIIGRTRAEMLALHPDSHRSADWAWLEGKVAAREPFNDFVYLNFSFEKTGPVWVRTSGAPHMDASGAFAGYRGIGSNVTTLYSALRRAEEANAAKTAFLATMSHEIRTPMNGVLGLAEELESRVTDAEDRKIAASIRESGVHLLTIINDILDVSKIEAGELVLEDAPFDLDDLLSRIIAVHEARAEEKGLELTRAPGPDAGLWRGDPHRVMQIVHNLVGNAVKFTETGGVRISVAEDPGGGFAISVADTGIGMSEEQVARVFDWFRQGDASTTRRYGGTGLGMSIVHDLTAAMGGRVDIDSTLGEGATFTITLPLARASSAPGPKPAPPKPAAPPRGLKLLAADDNATNRMLLELILKKAEQEVDIVESGAEAVAAAAERVREGAPYDLILMDIAMPEMDGVEALKAIRADEAAFGRRTPALAVTANVLSHQVAEYLALGFDGHVAKPIQRDALMAGMRRAVEAAAPRAAE